MPISRDIAQELILPLRIRGVHVALSQSRDEFAAFYTTSPEADPSRPFNCIVNLMQWLNEKGKPQYGTHPVGSRRIYTSLKPDLMTLAMADLNNFEIITVGDKPNEKWQVAALKYQLTDFDSSEWESRTALYEFFTLKFTSPGIHLTATGSDVNMRGIHRLYMMAAFALIIQGYDTDSRDEVGNVCAILVNASGRVMGFGRNTRGLNSTRHAEVNLIQALHVNHPNDYNQALDGSVLYTTLKPCKMCAGMIHHAGNGRIEVVYGQADNGPDAQGTLLDQYKKNWLLGAKGEKPILLPGNKSLHEELDVFRQIDKLPQIGVPSRGIIDSLDQPQSKLLMTGAVQQLKVKQDKYLDPLSFGKKYGPQDTEKALKYDEKQRVLTHLTSFLKSKQASFRM